LQKDQAVFLFDVSQANQYYRDRELIYSIDNGENLSYDYSKGDTLEIVTQPGKHSFQFYAGSYYNETPIASFKIEEQHRQMYKINFTRSEQIMHVRKPVIYLYPEEKTNISINVNPTGDLTFTYPALEGTWNITGNPDGTIQQGTDELRYLFWESNQVLSSDIIRRDEGAIVSGAEAVTYLEKQMQKFGMTSEERADFITYWGPVLQTKSNLYIYLLFDEACDAFASLEISPKPTQIGRFYIIWAAVPDDYNPSLEPQEVPKLQRDGFTVLEWGGTEVNASQILFEDL
jgi:hypothetical protein